MSNPYGPPPNGGQQGPGQYGASGGPSWGSPQGGSPYGPPSSPYGQGPGQQGPGQQGPGQQGPGQQGPGFGQTGQGGHGQGAPGQGGAGSWGGAPTKAKASMDLGKLLPLVLGVLGVLGFITGFLPGLKSALVDGSGSSLSESVYFTQGYLPILILIIGLLAVAPRLPGGKAYLMPTALLAVAALLGAIGALTAGTPEGATSGFGLILILIIAFLQALVAGYAWLVDSGVVNAPKPVTAATSPAPGFGPASSGPPALPQAPTGFAGYASGAYGSAPAQSQSPDAPSYSGYGSGSYSPPPGQVAPGYAPYTPPSSEPTYRTGSTPAAPPYGSAEGSGAPTSGTPTQAGPETGQHGRDDGPPPDVTQQVRF